MDNITEFAKCLTDETRIKILRLLAEGDLCVCEMVEVLKAPQARISQHLQRLRKEGLVEDSREGQWVIYSLNKKALKKKLKAARRFFLSGKSDAPTMAVEFERLANLQARAVAPEKAPENAPVQAPDDLIPDSDI